MDLEAYGLSRHEPLAPKFLSDASNDRGDPRNAKLLCNRALQPNDLSAMLVSESGGTQILPRLRQAARARSSALQACATGSVSPRNKTIAGRSLNEHAPIEKASVKRSVVEPIVARPAGVKPICSERIFLGPCVAGRAAALPPIPGQ